MKSAAIIVVGDEILSGKFKDENGLHAIRRFREAGVSLERLVVIPDSVTVIADEVKRASLGYDIVVTSGGIGPTHDDMTFEAVALAFGVPLIENEDLKQAISNIGWELSDAVMRMALIPKTSKVRWLEGIRYPVVQIENVTILPGVPSIFRMKFDRLLPDWSGVPVHSERVYVTDIEAMIAQRLSDIATRYDSVSIGSYPRFGEKEFKVIITLEGHDVKAIRGARQEIEGCMNTLNIESE